MEPSTSIQLWEVLREASEKDRAAIEATAAEAYDDLKPRSPAVRLWGPKRRARFIDNTLPDPRKGDPSDHVLVAERDGQILGYAKFAVRQRPGPLPLKIVVRPSLRGRGVGSKLLQAVTVTDKGPFIVQEFLSDPRTISFYEKLGYRQIERTGEARIDPASPPVSGWIDTVTGRIHPGFRILQADDRASTATKGDIARVQWRIFAWIQGFDPAAVEASDDLETSDDVDVESPWSPILPGTTSCAYVGDELVGTGALGDATQLAWDGPSLGYMAMVGVANPEISDAQEITAGLTAQCLATARRLGLQVHVELPDTNPLFSSCVRGIPGVEAFEDMILLMSPEPSAQHPG